MHGFRLALSPRTVWVDLTRDLVAAGAARVRLAVDRFSDLLVLTEQVAADFLEHTDENVLVAMRVDDTSVEVEFETIGVDPSLVTRLALARLADRKWQQTDESGTVTGFAFSG